MIIRMNTCKDKLSKLKKCKLTLLLLAIFCLLSFYVVNTQAAPVDDPQVVKQGNKYILLLPDKLLAVVAKQYPTFRIPKDTDITGAWARMRTLGTFPFATWGDFNGDGLTDVVLILINEKEWKQVIFNKTSSGYIPAKIDIGNTFEDPGGDPDIPQQFYVALIEKGHIMKFIIHPDPSKDTEETFTFKAVYDSIEGGVYEKSDWIIFWNGSEYEVIEIGE